MPDSAAVQSSSYCLARHNQRTVLDRDPFAHRIDQKMASETVCSCPEYLAVYMAFEEAYGVALETESFLMTEKLEAVVEALAEA